ncbi:MAG: L-histidine N(alpha)-methyltransferase [Bacteroidota bacterium]|nr:L-histidine N(alpha)-methyltransferase [Bacteroidota bacterium]
MNSTLEALSFRKDTINERLNIYYLNNLSQTNTFAEEVKLGLTSERKFLLPKYFYDERGSKLFEQICRTKEYYPTRTETNILKNLSDTISERNKDKNLIVELGSGSSLKTNYLIKSFLKTRDRLCYTPIDVSNILVESSKLLIETYEKLFINGIVSFYKEGIDFIFSLDNSPKLIIFLGSSIGNFTEEERILFMKMLKNDMKEADRLLIGFDLVKDKKVLEDAYNDSKGITAEFNLNILHRINTELDGKFNLKKFEHKAIFNADESRIEMYLIAKEKMEIAINGIEETIKFEKEEKIHTENSYKFTNEMINRLAENSGLEFSDCYSDERNYFSLCAFRPK